ncbi:MAG: ribonuclease H [Gemmatimonadales bacterium]
MTPSRPPTDFVLIHADESCLRNGQEGSNPGGAGSLIEIGTPDGVARRDVFISSPDTTNNRMALAGAIATFALLSRKGNRFRVLFVSDSQYLVKGMTDWVRTWRARGWTRKGGPIENLELWQKLVQAAAGHMTTWRWVRGHAGNPKNEYSNYLAMWAANEQLHSRAAEPSRFEEWFADRRTRGQFVDFDPDDDYMVSAQAMGA